MEIEDQIQHSKFSKQGKTSLTGIFEGTPENAVNKKRGTTVPTNSQQQPIVNPINAAINSNRNPTYLESLQLNKKL